MKKGRHILIILIVFTAIFGLFQYLTPIYNSASALIVGGGGGTPTPTACTVSGYCSGNVCGTGTYRSGAGGACRCLPVSGNCSTKQSGTSHQCGAYYPYIVGVACPTPTPPPPPPSPTISSDPTFYDNSIGQNLAVNSNNGYYNDNVTAKVYVTNASTISASIYESDNQGDGLSWSNNPSITNFGGGWYGFSFNLDPLSNSPVSGEVYTWAVQFWASGYGTVYSNKDNISMVYPTTTAFSSCNTPSDGRLLASNLSGQKDIVMFNNDPTNGCKSSFYFNNSGEIGQHITAAVSAPGESSYENTWAGTYNNDAKDSILFFPTGKVTDDQCSYGTPAYDESSQTALVSGLTTGDIWLVHWCYDKTANIVNTIALNPTAPTGNSVRVTPVVIGTPGNSADMEIDAQNYGSPRYFWYTYQTTQTYRINWSAVYSIYNNWRSNSFESAPSPININSCSASTNQGTQPCVFQNGSSMNGFYSNGTKTINAGGSGSMHGNTFISIIHNGSNTRGLDYFWSEGASYEGGVSLDTGIQGAGFSLPSGAGVSPLTFLQCDGCDGGGDLWHLDGMTASPDNKYLFVSSGGGRLIFVFYNVNGTPQYAGLVPIVGSNSQPLPNSSPNGGFDGIEVDQNNMLYIADETQGIWVANAIDIENAAWMNGGNIRAKNWVQAVQYTPSVNGENWDDIAPLSGTGASSTVSFSPYVNTRMGSIYSDGGFSISSLNSVYDNTDAYFGTYPVMGGGIASVSNGIASHYNWIFNGYTSGIVANHSSPKYGYKGLWNLIQENPNNTFQAYTPNTIAYNTTLPGGTDSSGKNIVYYHNGDLSIDGSGNNYQGISANGIMFINGNVTITANPFNQFNKGNLFIISTGNITINPTNYYTNTNNSALQDQYVNLGMSADGNITVSGYPTFPNYIQPMQIKGVMVDYGTANTPPITKSTNLNFDLGYYDQWYPSIQIIYDPTYINLMSSLFLSPNTAQEVGL